MAKSVKHKWAFPARFRSGAYGWKASKLASKRIREAVSEIKKASRKDRTLGAEGAVLFLEKLFPATQKVDDSWGTMRNALHKAVDALVDVILAAYPVDEETHTKWLDRIWEAYNETDFDYLMMAVGRWGELCRTPEIASRWADDLMHPMKYSWSSHLPPGSYFRGTTACLSCLLASGRYQDLLDLLDEAPHPFLDERLYGVKALVALGKAEEAIQYAKDSRERDADDQPIAQAIEDILLAEGRREEAYRGYALVANEKNTNLATFRATVKKYPAKDGMEILQDLIASTPGREGKWFATARQLGFYDLALMLARKSPCDPKTLNRAAKDNLQERPRFALETALASLRWLADDYGYEISNLDVREAYRLAMEAARLLGEEDDAIARIRSIVEADRSAGLFVQESLKPFLK